MTKFQNIFHVNLEKKPWYRIALWWEICRIPYNVFLMLIIFSLDILIDNIFKQFLFATLQI